MQDHMSDYAQRIARIQQDYNMNGSNKDRAQKQRKRRIFLSAGCDRRDDRRIILYCELFIGRRTAIGR